MATNNEIALTIRIPDDLNEGLTKTAKDLGMTKLNLIRFAIWDFLENENCKLLFSTKENNFRVALKVNKNTYQLLEQASKQYGQSINSIVIAVTTLALTRYSKYL